MFIPIHKNWAISPNLISSTLLIRLENSNSKLEGELRTERNDRLVYMQSMRELENKNFSLNGELQRVREERDSLQDLVNNLRSRSVPTVNPEEIRQKLMEELS